MENIEVDSRNKFYDSFDLENELSALVEKNVISKRLADRLQRKIIEKKVNITKEQLQMLVKKIEETLRIYNRNAQTTKDEDSTTKTEKTTEKKSNADMKQLYDTVEKLKQKIQTIETGIFKDENKIKALSPKIFTTDDLKIPTNVIKSIKEFKFEPLTEIPNDPESIIVLMRWLQYLIDKCGHSNLPTIFDYYIDIGWISPEAKLSLIDYSNGITEDNCNEEMIKREINDLPSKDHIQSLIFIQKLKGIDIDKHFIDKIEDELSRTTKKLENYHFK